MPKEIKSSFSHFFREDAKIVEEVLREDVQLVTEEKSMNEDKFPTFVKGDALSADEIKEVWRNLRLFFRNGYADPPLPVGFTPLVISSAYTDTLTAAEYPVWVTTNESTIGQCVPFRNLIETAFERLDREDSILKNFLGSLIHLANVALQNGPLLISDLNQKIFSQLEKQLDVGGDEGVQLRNDIQNLVGILPNQGSVFTYTSEATFLLLNAAITNASAQARKNLKEQIVGIKTKLNDLLRVEEQKGTENQDPHRLSDSLGFMGGMMKFEALADLTPIEGSESMDSIRLDRISKIIRDLEESEVLLDFSAIVSIDEALYQDHELYWQKMFDKAELQPWSEADGLKVLEDQFTERIAPYVQLLRAKRMGELEIENIYQCEIHDDYFQHFSWQNFTEEELNQSTYFALIVDDIHVFGEDFIGLSRMLSENVPIKIFALKRNCFSTSGDAGVENSISLHSPVEMGGLMMSYKNIYVAQTSAINPLQLYRQFVDGLTAFAPAFIYMLAIQVANEKNNFLSASAEVESRDFPGFTFNGRLGTPWGNRFAIDNNPQADESWPLHEVMVLNAEEENEMQQVHFTFADWCAANPNYSKYFYPVPVAAWTDDLIPIHEYLETDVTTNIGKIPFIWMVDTENHLCKVAVSWPVIIGSQERLDFWNFLQENSGIHNFHAAQAVREVEKELAKKHALALEQLKDKYEAEIEHVKKEEAGKVMENLAAVLLDMDLSSSGLPKVAKPIPITQPEIIDPEEKTPDIAVLESPEEKDSFDMEAYIDTALCTSCNECINKNKAMFRYNGDKMAFIADAHAGTFRQLVEAAEACPVSIIHPGTPLDPREPELADLIKRAAKFN